MPNPSVNRCRRALICALLLLTGNQLALAAPPEPEIMITGGVKSLRENVQHFLPFAEEDCNTPPWRLRAQLRNAQNGIRQAGQALGYYRLTFTSELTLTDDCWRVDIALTPGEPVRVTELRVALSGGGSDDPAFEEIYANPGIKVGDRLNHGRYEALKTRLTTLAAARGYFDGFFELAQVSVNIDENSARIALIYASGPRYHFGQITLQQDILDDDFVARYLNIAEGDVYDSEQLLALKTRYNASNYFAMATISPDLQTLEDSSVPITVQLDARKRHSYSMGAGVATDTGPRLLLGFEDRYLTQQGHSFQANTHIATVKSDLEANYIIPMSRPAYEFIKISAGFQYEEAGDTESELYKLGTSYTTYEENAWRQTYGIDYQREYSTIGTEDERHSNLLIPSALFSRTDSDGNPYPMYGWRLMGRLSGSPKTLGSDVSFVQFNGSAKIIYPVLGGRLLLRTEIGITEMGDEEDFDDLPVSLRFFAGGDASVRGYSYKSIGHKNAQGEVIGGHNLVAASIEYDYLIKPKWALAVFYDQGDAPEDYHFEFKRSVGLGVRWISPIGPVRIDLACALDEVRCSSSSADGWGLHLSMGPDL